MLFMILPLQIQPQEEQALINAFKSGPDQLQAHGIHIGGTKYMFLRPNGDSFYGKKGVRSHSVISYLLSSPSLICFYARSFTWLKRAD